MSFPDIIINDLIIPRLACLEMSQDYKEIAPRSLLRLSNGTGVPQTYAWSKLATTINVPRGWTTSGLAGIDFEDPAGFSLACIKPRSAMSASNMIALTLNRRLDEPVLGWAMIGNQLVMTDVSIAADVATLTPVAGATQYKVEWLPLLQCFSVDGPQETYGSGSNEHGFTLQAEEI